MWVYRLAEWRLESDFQYDGLPTCDVLTGSGSDQPTIRVQKGHVPDLDLAERRFHILSEGEIFYTVDGFFRCLISDGTTVTVDVINLTRIQDVPGFLLGCVFGALCHQRRELVLHAGCVEIDGRAVVMAGPSGIGKSTFTAALMQCGYRILSDDVIILRLAAEPSAVPTVARCKLWKDSVTALKLEPERKLSQRYKQTDTGSWAKYECLAGDMFCTEARRIDQIVLLLPAGHEKSGCSLTASEAAYMLWNNIYQRDLATEMGRTSELFSQCVSLATQVRHVFWSGTTDLRNLPNNIDSLLAMIKENGAWRPQ